MAILIDIETALLARVAALILSPALPVAWPNVAFTKPSGGYLRVNHVPNTSRRIMIGSSEPHMRRGILQVDVFRPKNEGTALATALADQIAAWFPADMRLGAGGVTVRVTKASDAAIAVADDTHWQVPVTVSYECFA
jgi:hypothetical protein